jgi:hypothetical protein
VAVRFAGAGTDFYSTTTNLPLAPFTVTFWTMIVTDRNTFSSWLAYNTGTNKLWLQSLADGTTPAVFDTTGVQRIAGSSMTVGAWYRIGLVVNGTSTVLYQSDANTPSTTAFTTATFTDPSGVTVLSLGASASTIEPLNGRMAAVKFWTAALTKAEIDAELTQVNPIRTVNLQRFYPLHNAELTDYSGNRNDLTAGSVAATTEPDPPIPDIANALLPRMRPPGLKSPGGRFAPFFSQRATDLIGGNTLAGDAVLDVTAATTAAGLLAAQAAAAVVATATVTTAGARTTATGAALAGTAAIATAGYPWGPPHNLTATPISATQIDLSWTAMPGVSGYDIERNGVVIATDVIGTSYSDTGLTGSTTYTYRARSVA